MAFAPTTLKKRVQESENLNLSSMMDLMTIILLFLIKSYSSTGMLIQDVEGINLPLSTTATSPKKVLTLAVDAEAVWLDRDGQRVERFESMDFLLTESDDPAAMTLPGLSSFLESEAEMGREREQYGVKFTGEINIIADAQVQYNAILKILQTCYRAGFPQTDFVVLKED
jgi:biopolymer transport protein ExbD